MWLRIWKFYNSSLLTAFWMNFIVIVPVVLLTRWVIHHV